MVTGRGVVASVLFGAVVAGCSSSASEEPADPEPSKGAESTQKGNAGPLEVADGVVVPQSLSELRCAPGGKGRWNVSGTLTNDEADAADFRVTVVVAPPGTQAATAREITVPDVPSGKSVDFASRRLPATTGDDQVCSVQVVRLR